MCWIQLGCPIGPPHDTDQCTPHTHRSEAFHRGPPSALRRYRTLFVSPSINSLSVSSCQRPTQAAAGVRYDHGIPFCVSQSPAPCLAHGPQGPPRSSHCCSATTSDFLLKISPTSVGLQSFFCPPASFPVFFTIFHTSITLF